MPKNEIDIEMGKKFNSAAAFVAGAQQYGKRDISQSNLLKLYGLYKQSTCFDDFSSAVKPSFWNFAATRKYWAWEEKSKLRGVIINCLGGYPNSFGSTLNST